jgi:hypothetical protein
MEGEYNGESQWSVVRGQWQRQEGGLSFLVISVLPSRVVWIRFWGSRLTTGSTESTEKKEEESNSFAGRVRCG